MKNFWLEYAKKERRTFHDIIVEGMYAWPTDLEMANALESLATTLVHNFYAGKNIPFDEDDLIQELLFFAYEKLPRFDPEKGNAFHYFTTCMLGHLRQFWRAPKRK